MDRRRFTRIAPAALALLACLLAAPLAARADAAASKKPVLRAAFYYPWFPQAWQQGGIEPFTQFRPSLGFYSSSQRTVIRRQIADMQYGHIQAGIASWWGRGTHTDARMPLLLNAASGTGFTWTVYYELEGQADPDVAQIRSDLAYLRSRYASDPSYLRRGGRFVVFVYAQPADGCGMADRWKQANTVGAHVVLKVFPGYLACASQPAGWHQYSPAVAADGQPGISFAVSPGFYKAGEPAPRLARNLARWRRDVRAMARSAAPLQLVTTYNEWGEGTSVESAATWASRSGHGAYMDALHAWPVPGARVSAARPVPRPRG
jgi:glycosyl hydrolase family 99